MEGGRREGERISDRAKKSPLCTGDEKKLAHPSQCRKGTGNVSRVMTKKAGKEEEAKLKIGYDSQRRLRWEEIPIPRNRVRQRDEES